MRKQHDVTLIIVPSSDNQIRMIRGVMDFARDRGSIRIVKNAAIPYVSWSMIDKVESDGVIAYAESAEQLALLAKLHIRTRETTRLRTPLPAAFSAGHTPRR